MSFKFINNIGNEPAKKDKVEFVRITSGPKKTSNALNLLTRALYNINKNRFAI